MTEFPPKAEFRKWLRGLPPEEVVADDWSCSSCPLSRWLEASGIPSPLVDPALNGGGKWRDAFGEERALPYWANQFGLWIDDLGNEQADDDISLGPVTAADCLRVLARTPRE